MSLLLLLWWSPYVFLYIQKITCKNYAMKCIALEGSQDNIQGITRWRTSQIRIFASDSKAKLQLWRKHMASQSLPMFSLPNGRQTDECRRRSWCGGQKHHLLHSTCSKQLQLFPTYLCKYSCSANSTTG